MVGKKMKQKLTILIVLLLIPFALADTPQFEVAVEDNSPTSDIFLSIDILNDLAAEGYDIPVGSAKLFSEIDATDLEDQVTLVIYQGDARIIYDAQSEDQTDFVSDLENILDDRDVDVDIISQEIIEEENLLTQFDVEISDSECFDSDGDDKNTYGYVDVVIGDQIETIEDYCIGSQVVMEHTCEDDVVVPNSYSCENGCTNGKCNLLAIEPEVTVADPIIEEPMIAQKVVLVTGSQCQENSQCQSGICKENICKSPSIWDSIIEWFKNLLS